MHMIQVRPINPLLVQRLPVSTTFAQANFVRHIDLSGPVTDVHESYDYSQEKVVIGLDQS